MDLKTYLSENIDPVNDEYSKVDLHDTRRPRITFRHLNRLRKINELKRLEQAAHKEFVRAMYGKPPENTGGGMF